MTQDRLIKALIIQGVLKTSRVISAFRQLDRADFVPSELKESAYIDTALPTTAGQTISQPLVVAFMLELLAPKAGQTILDIGAGSGWTSALLAQIVGPKGHVFAIERSKEVSQFGQANLKKYPELSKWITYLCQDASTGLADQAPFDRIMASAEVSQIPPAWQDQLKRPGGRLVVPINQALRLLVAGTKHSWRRRDFPGFVFVPFIAD